MCDACGVSPCRRGCPEAGLTPPLAFCECCGAEIFAGELVLPLGGGKFILFDCFAAMSGREIISFERKFEFLKIEKLKEGEPHDTKRNRIDNHSD